MSRCLSATVILLAGAFLALAGVSATGAASVPRAAAQPAPGGLPLPATWAGTLPCADCEGIRYWLNLDPDGIYILRRTYLGRGAEGGEDVYDLGVWTLADGGATLVLRGQAGEPEQFAVREPTRLRQLGRMGNEIESRLDCDLLRQPGFAPIEPRLHLRGMYRYFADAGSLRECLTGRIFPVTPQAESAELERAYLDARRQPEEEVLVEIGGRIARRPSLEGGGVREYVVVEEITAVRPGETCGAPFASSPLENTYWALVSLGSQPVARGETEREAHLVLVPGNGQVRGFGGCNGFFGTYEVSGETIGFSALGATKMMCPGIEQEDAFFRAIEAAVRWSIEGEHLDLIGGDGSVVARFEAKVME